MQKFSKVLAGLGVVVCVVLIGLGIGWLATRTPKTQLPPPNTDVAATSDPSVTANRNTTKPVPAPGQTNLAAVVPGVVQIPPDVTQVNATNTWEDQLDDILSSESEDTNKVKQLFAMFRTLPPEGQEEVVQHLSNLVEDEDYAPLGQMLLDTKLSEEVLDVLMADLLNRPNATKLPMFLQVARTPEHPQAQEAKDLLELYLDEDYGTDWNKWQQEMEKWLKDPENQD
jgi:hypothetical protein